MADQETSPAVHPQAQSNLTKLLLWTNRFVCFVCVPFAVIFSVYVTYLLYEGHQHRQDNITKALASLGTSIPTVKDISQVSREHRPSVTLVTFANGQTVTLTTLFHGIYLQFPISQWDQAVALQREGDRRVRAGEGQGLYVDDDNMPVINPKVVPATGANAVVAFNRPQPDCYWCDRATLSDGTTVALGQNDTVLIALPLSMLPQVLALPGTPSKAYH